MVHIIGASNSVHINDPLPPRYMKETHKEKRKEYGTCLYDTFLFTATVFLGRLLRVRIAGSRRRTCQVFPELFFLIVMLFRCVLRERNPFAPNISERFWAGPLPDCGMSYFVVAIHFLGNANGLRVALARLPPSTTWCLSFRL